MKIGAGLPDLRLDMSSGLKWPKVGSSPRPRQDISEFNWIHHSTENEVLFVKIEARVLELWLDTSSSPNWPKCSFKGPGLKVNKFFEIS